MDDTTTQQLAAQACTRVEQLVHHRGGDQRSVGDQAVHTKDLGRSHPPETSQHERPKLSAAVDLAWARSAADLMTVEMLDTEGCPHEAAYLPHLQQLVADAALDEPVQTRLVVYDDQAQHERFLGSPTIRVNGADVDPGAIGREDFGLSCP